MEFPDQGVPEDFYFCSRWCGGVLVGVWDGVGVATAAGVGEIDLVVVWDEVHFWFSLGWGKKWFWGRGFLSSLRCDRFLIGGLVVWVFGRYGPG
jgi:hypothetical protein